jgi:hypothetical protein
MTDRAQPAEIPMWERIFYGVILVAALFVALLGYLAPARMDRAFTWAELPPLHARFVATLYLFGAVYLFAALIARRARSVRSAMGGIAVFTGVLFLVTVRNPDAFDLDLVPVWIWIASYVIYPLVALGFLWARRGRPTSGVNGRRSPSWVREVLVLHAVVFGVLGLLMFVVPDTVAAVWPWPVTPGVVQACSSPFLTVAFLSGAYAHRSVWPDVTPLLPALLVLEGGTLILSAGYSNLFRFDEVATWAWFVGFGVGAGTVVAALVATVTARPLRDPASAQPVPPTARQGGR